jgi:demethylmenaquinone methyltransferase/2-methoxy-6-polyprenyl-1,4-benzoquinol methylase
LKRWYGEPGTRAEFVTGLFDRTARHYDLVCKAMAFGTGQMHRRRALRWAGFRAGMRLLDLATGTGLVAQAALELGASPAQVVGCDPSLGMLAENKKRRSIGLVRGGGEALPFADASFDFVSIGYALRHVPDLAELFSGIARVLRPGGRLLVLEITKPRSRLGTALCRLYLRRIVPLWAWIASGDREAALLMQYYWDTIEACVPPQTVLGAMEEAGLREPTRRISGGILSDYVAQRG